MNFIKKIISRSTGYWLHKNSTLPVGADLFLDIHRRIKYGNIHIMFDVGANTGQTLQWFRLNEARTKIYSFEPVAATYAQLKANASEDKNCVLENIAFAEAAGQKTIKLFDEYTFLNSLKDELMNHNANAKTETISINTVDNYCREKKIHKIDFLKIDTEGYEINVLKGATDMLRNASISFIYCEIGFLKRNARNTYFSELTEWLADHDYYFFGLYQLDAHGWKNGDYFGNALFVHKDIFAP